MKDMMLPLRALFRGYEYAAGRGCYSEDMSMMQRWDVKADEYSQGRGCYLKHM